MNAPAKLDPTAHGVVLHLAAGSVRIHGRDPRGWVGVRCNAAGKETGGEVVVPVDEPFMVRFVRMGRGA